MKIFRVFTKDNLVLGLVLGFLAPFLGMYGFYHWKIGSANGSFFEFFHWIFADRRVSKLLTNMVTFSLLANAILFTVYVNTNRYRTARGIFILTMLYAIPIIIWKIFY